MIASDVVAALYAATPTPSPSGSPDPLAPQLDPYQVSPGLVGFLAIFAVAVAAVFLFLSMTKHMRRAGHNDRVRQEREAAAAAESLTDDAAGGTAATGPGAAASDTPVDGDDTPGPDSQDPGRR